MKINNKYLATSATILLLRLLDLFTTYDAVVDFQNQEMNIIVKIFNLNIWMFFMFEILLTFGLISIYNYSKRYPYEFNIKATSLGTYTSLLLYNKNNINLNDLLKINYKGAITLIGALTPEFIIPTSIIYILNNLWVNSVVRENEVAIKYYYMLNDYYFFDILIFGLPILLLMYLTYNKLNIEYKAHNIEKQNKE